MNRTSFGDSYSCNSCGERFGQDQEQCPICGSEDVTKNVPSSRGTFIEDVINERKRQVEEERWTHEHDDRHVKGSLANAAACYAAPEQLYVRVNTNHDIHFIDPWPWPDGSTEYVKDGKKSAQTARYSSVSNSCRG